MKTKILSGLMCCLGIFSANAQTITAPAGQALTVTNSIDVTNLGGSVNVPADGTFKIGGNNVLSTKGLFNFIAGEGAGQNNTGQNNMFLGSQAGSGNTTGYSNVMIGTAAGSANVTGGNNVFIGVSAGRDNGAANFNTFIGGFAGRFTQAGYNTFFGNSSGYNTTTGSANVGLGVSAGQDNITGTGNIFIGNNSGTSNSAGFHNTFIGTNSSAASSSLSFATAIGFGAIINASNTVVLGNAATTITGAGLATNNSGLKFANLTSASTPVGPASGGKVLSVDGSGNVVLVSTGLGVNGVVGPLEITSVLSGSGLKFTNLTSASLPVNPSFTGGKVLSVDLLGNVILVSLNGATTNAVGGPVAESWKESDGYLYNNSTNGVVIKGTGLDGNSLIVKGGVLSKEVNVKVEGSEAWPDYVFKSNYKRMSLGDVEKFIAINGHLPNVPSATEMAISGNNLGKTDVKLLEKVEELTLYLLDMKKVNDAQAAQLKSLKQQVNKLRKK